jgi:hypothetical protein
MCEAYPLILHHITVHALPCCWEQLGPWCYQLGSVVCGLTLWRKCTYPIRNASPYPCRHGFLTQLHLSPIYFNWNSSVTGHKLLSVILLAPVWPRSQQSKDIRQVLLKWYFKYMLCVAFPCSFVALDQCYVAIHKYKYTLYTLLWPQMVEMMPVKAPSPAFPCILL